MNSSYMTEMSLRVAANAVSRELGETAQNQEQQLKDIALNKAKSLLNANETVSSIASQMNLQEMAINLAVEGIKLAYSAITSQLDFLKQKRLSYDKERLAGIATFTLPLKKEEQALTEEEIAIKSFLALVSSKPQLYHFLGVHQGQLSQDQNYEYYSIVPFYNMSRHLKPPLASIKPLERERASISLFLKSILPNAISNIDKRFQMEVKLYSFCVSIWHQENYLNNYRTPRFMMMGLANLLWNLQHPVDIKTGFPLNTSECIALCYQAELILNQILDDSSPPYIAHIANKKNALLSFVRKIEIQIKELRLAYAYEQLHEINIADVTNSAHRALRVMDNSIFKLIYRRLNPLSKKKEPDEHAAEELAYLVSYLNQLIRRNPQLLESFNPYRKYVPNQLFLNERTTTIMDALIIFCHLIWEIKDKLLKKIRATEIDSALEFAGTLEYFNKKFIKPIKKINKRELNAHWYHTKVHEVAILNARRMIPLITLVTEDYRVIVDTTQARKSDEAAEVSLVFSGNEQIQLINEMAQDSEFDRLGYYYWTLSHFFDLAYSTATKLNDLPKYQYRMTKMTKLMDSIAELIEYYRNFLQYPVFIAFINHCLELIRRGYIELDHLLETVDNEIVLDEKIDRSLTGILRPMLEELDQSLTTFTRAVEHFSGIISKPDFSDQQKLILSGKFQSIEHQYKSLFGDQNHEALRQLYEIKALAGLNSSQFHPSQHEPTNARPLRRTSATELPHPLARSRLPTDEISSESPQSTPTVHSPEPVAAAPNELMLLRQEKAKPARLSFSFKSPNPELRSAPMLQIPLSSTKNSTGINLSIKQLKKLIERCYQALSYPSRWGEKGELLLQLQHLVQLNPNINEVMIQQIVLELTRIVCAYRPSLFFSAPYAQTRSAQPLIEAMLDPEINTHLPLLSILFPRDSNEVHKAPRQVQHKLILERIKELKNAYFWEESSVLMAPIGII